MAFRDLPRAGNEFYIDPRQLKPLPGGNPRSGYPEEEYQALKSSIQEGGVKKPIQGVFLDGEFYSVGGHTRIQACLELLAEGKGERVERVRIRPISMENAPKDQEALAQWLLIQAIEDNDGVPLSQLDLGKSYQKLIDSGLTVDQVATSRRVSVTAIRDALKVVALPEKIQVMISDGKLSPSTAVSTFEEYGDSAEAAIESGKAFAGDGKVTRKHMERGMLDRQSRGEDGDSFGGDSGGEKPSSLKKLVKEILLNAEFHLGTDGWVDLRITEDAYRGLCERVGLK